MTDSRTSENDLPPCVCGHPEYTHLTTVVRRCGMNDCDCADYEPSHAAACAYYDGFLCNCNTKKVSEPDAYRCPCGLTSAACRESACGQPKQKHLHAVASNETPTRCNMSNETGARPSKDEVNRIVQTVQAWPLDSSFTHYQRWALLLVREIVELRSENTGLKRELGVLDDGPTDETFVHPYANHPHQNCACGAKVPTDVYVLHTCGDRLSPKATPSKANAEQVMHDVARRAAALIPTHSDGGEGPTLEINLKASVHLCAPHGKDWLTCPECAKAADKMAVKEREGKL